MDHKPRKKSVNLSIDAELAELAKETGTNMSAILERELQKHLSEHRAQKWRAENRRAIEKSNQELRQNGMWYTPQWGKK